MDERERDPQKGVFAVAGLTSAVSQDAEPGLDKPSRNPMLSPSDTLLILIVALLLFGPDQMPKIARRLAEGLRGMQATTHSFMLEMERAAAPSDANSGEPAEVEAQKPDDSAVKPAESIDADS